MHSRLFMGHVLYRGLHLFIIKNDHKLRDILLPYRLQRGAEKLPEIGFEFWQELKNPDVFFLNKSTEEYRITRCGLSNS